MATNDASIQRELDAIGQDIAAIEALIDALKALADRIQVAVEGLRQRETLQ